MQVVNFASFYPPHFRPFSKYRTNSVSIQIYLSLTFLLHHVGKGWVETANDLLNAPNSASRRKLEIRFMWSIDVICVPANRSW